MKVVSLFAGMGGFDLAADWMGWEIIAHCEWNAFGQYILKEHWPNAITYEDITKTDFTSLRGRVDIVTGGFPCQPYSVAGKRKGKEDGRHLWPEMFRAVREIAPRWVVGENVRGIINWDGGVVFDEVQADLEAEGYEILPFLFPAASVNAPHERYRTWFVAYAHDKGSCAGLRTVPEADGEISKWNKDAEPCNSSATNVANSNNESLQRGETSGYVKIKESETFQQFMRHDKPSYWHDFPTQPPVFDRDDGFPSELVRQRIREDSMGHLSEKEIDKIISEAFNKWREESIKAGGNAIVPQVVYQIFKAIEQYELS